jgi:hypothetical protein
MSFHRPRPQRVSTAVVLNRFLDGDWVKYQKMILDNKELREKGAVNPLGKELDLLENVKEEAPQETDEEASQEVSQEANQEIDPEADEEVNNILNHPPKR